MVDATNVFGPSVLRSDVEEAVIAHLQTWMPTYLAEQERRKTIAAGTYQARIPWESTNEFPMPEDGTVPPRGIVVSPGTARPPEKKANGEISLWWDIRVVIVVDAATAADSNRLSAVYAWCAMAALLQEPISVGDQEAYVEYLGEGNTITPAEHMKTGWASEQLFEILTAGVVTRFGGPAEPDLDPGAVPAFQTAEILTDARRPT